MRATFTMAARYQVCAVCQSPIRTGGTGLTTEQLLTDTQGRPYFQGTSLAGALREYHRTAFGEEKTRRLFGDLNGAGHIVISDGDFSGALAWETRPRLRIDGRTGTADGRGKFDVAHLPVGTKLTFSVTWMGTEEDAEELNQIEQALAALHCGYIRLGAQKANGFGRVTLEVRKQSYRMADERDRTAWLENRDASVPLALPKVKQPGQITFELQGHADSILVKAGAAEWREGRNVTTHIQEQGVPVLPGSSVKGALRSRVAQIARLMGADGVEAQLFGRSSGDEDNGVAGRVIVDDVRLSKEQKREISRIRINRFTAGVMRQGLFTEEPVCSPVTCRLSAPETLEHLCGYLVYALRDLGLGLYNLGSGGAVGRGYLRVETIRVTMPDGRSGVLRFDGQRRCTVEDAEGVLRDLCGRRKEGER